MSDRLKNIQKAQAITDRVFTEIIKFIRPGLTEKTVAKQIEKLMRQYGGDNKPAFPSLVCSGKRTALFHGPTSGKKIRKGDIVFLDFGAKYLDWCSDMTRTVFVGKPKPRLLKIYQIVLDTQKKQIAKVKARVNVADIDELGRRLLRKHGLDGYFTHTTGHGLGRNVHQKPRISNKSKAKLKSGDIITIEPGVYVPGLGGVRIEDMLLVKRNGCLNLTKSPKNVVIIDKF